MNQHPSKITPKIDPKKGTEKRGRTPDPAECAQVPNPIISKDILRQKTNEESRLKGEYKVECKKWSAKGTYRKASADREPTTDVNTLGGQRPRADLSGSSAHSAALGVYAPLWTIFVDFSGFGADFFMSQKTSKKHLLPERPQISKIRRPGDFWSHFGRLFEPFWRPFARKNKC